MSKVENVCRVCLGEEGLSSIFTGGAVPMSSMMMVCAQVQVAKGDGLPALVCKDCAYRLCVSFNFKLQCESSDRHLRRMLATSADGHKSVQNSKEANSDDLDARPELESKLSKELNTISRATNDKLPDIKKKIFSRPKKKRLSEPEKCNQCGKTFNFEGSLKTHLRKHKNQRSFNCSICNKKFNHSGNLILHMRIHTGERPYQCELCSKQFSTSSNLKAHMKSHTDERNYPCLLCPKAFKSSTDLASHAGTHTGIKNRICKICGKGFYKTNYLTTHMKTVHVGEKKHKCTACGKEFPNSSNLSRHLRIHTGEKPFSCTHCSSVFNQSSALQRHLKQHLAAEGKPRGRKAKKDPDKSNIPFVTLMQ